VQVAALAASQYDQGKLTAKDSHFAVFNIAAVTRNKFRNFFDKANLIWSDGGEDQMVPVCHRFVLCDGY
jgi:hypothetical protein